MFLPYDFGLINISDYMQWNDTTADGYTALLALSDRFFGIGSFLFMIRFKRQNTLARGRVLSSDVPYGRDILIFLHKFGNNDETS